MKPNWTIDPPQTLAAALREAATLAAMERSDGLAEMIRHSPASGTVHAVPAVLRHYAQAELARLESPHGPRQVDRMTTPAEWLAIAAQIQHLAPAEGVGA